MHLKQDHTYSTVDLYKMFDTSKVKGIGKGRVSRKYNCRDKRALAQKIFLRYLYLLLSDLVEGGKIFYFPSKHLSCLKMSKVTGEKFKFLRKKGYFRNVDFLVSNFSGYFLSMEYLNTKGNPIHKPLALSSQFVERITEKTNTGYKYC